MLKPLSGQSHRDGYARCSNKRLLLLHSMDSTYGRLCKTSVLLPVLTVYAAFCGRRPPATEPLPSSCMGYPNPGDIDLAGFRRGRLIFGYGYDQEQPEKGCKGKSGKRGEEIEMRAVLSL